MIRTFCPGCGQDYNVEDGMIGQKVQCERCGTVWEIPPYVAPSLQTLRAAPQSAPAQKESTGVKIIVVILLVIFVFPLGFVLSAAGANVVGIASDNPTASGVTGIGIGVLWLVAFVTGIGQYWRKH